MTSLKVLIIFAFVIFCQAYISNHFSRKFSINPVRIVKKNQVNCLGSGDDIQNQNDGRFNGKVAGVLYLLSLSFFMCVADVKAADVESIPRWNIYSRMARVEDIMFTKSDAAAMEKRNDEKYAAMEKRMDEMEKRSMAFSLFLALVSQALPIQLYLDKKNSPP